MRTLRRCASEFVYVPCEGPCCVGPDTPPQVIQCEREWFHKTHGATVDGRWLTWRSDEARMTPEQVRRFADRERSAIEANVADGVFTAAEAISRLEELQTECDERLDLERRIVEGVSRGTLPPRKRYRSLS